MNFKTKQLQAIMRGLSISGRSKATKMEDMIALIGQEDLAFISNSMKVEDITLEAAIVKCRQQKNSEKDVVRKLNDVIGNSQEGSVHGVFVPVSKAFETYVPYVKELDGYKSRSLSKPSLTIQQFVIEEFDEVPLVAHQELRLQDSPLFASIRKYGDMDSIINVELKSKTVAQLALRNGLFVDMTTKKLYVAKNVVRRDESGKKVGTEWKFVEVNGGTTYTVEGFRELREKRKIMKFNVLGSSPSMIRKLQVYLISNDINGAELLDELTGGYFGRYDGEEMSKKNAIKVASRILQSAAGQKDMGEVSCYAIIGKKLSLTVIPKSGDGQCYLLDTHMQKLFNETTGLDFKISEIEGLAMQCRPFYSLAKVLGHCVNESYIWENIRKYGRDAVVRVQPGTDIFDGSFDDKVVIVGSGTPQVLIDHDGLKGAFNTALTQSMTVLDIAQLSGASLNIQTLQKFCDHEDFGTYINGIIDRFVVETIEDFVYVQEKNVTVADCAFIDNFVSKVNPEFCNQDYVLRENKIRKMAESLTRRANAMKLPIDGNFVRLVCDPVREFFAYGILEIDEFYCNGIYAELMALVKFPSMGRFEVLVAKRVSYREVCRRIMGLLKKGELTGKQAEVLRRRFKKMSKGVMAVSGDSNLKDYLAGLDFDFDGALAILDKEIIRMIQESGRNLIVHIDSDVKKNEVEEKIVFSFENMGQIIEGFFLSDTANVGEVSNANDRTLALRFQSEITKRTLLMQSLEMDNEGTEEYVPVAERWSYAKFSTLTCKKGENKKTIVRPSKLGASLIKWNALCKRGHYAQLVNSKYKHVHVTSDIALGHIEMMKRCTLSNEVMDCMIDDINVFMRMYQERTIDAPKTADTVKLDFKPLFRIKSHIAKDAVFTIEKGLTFGYKDPEMTDEKYDRALSCPVSSSKDYFYSKIASAVLLLPEYDGLGDDVLETLSDVFTSDRYGNIVYVLSIVREMYFTITGLQSKEEKTKALKVLSNQARRFLYSRSTMKFLYGKDAVAADPSVVGYVAKALSLKDENGKLNPKGNNKFASTLFPEEYQLAIADYFTDGGEYLMVEEPVRGSGFVPFEEVDFVDGLPVGKQGMAINKFTAKMRMIKKGGKWYATSLASDVIKANIKKEMNKYADYAFVRVAGTLGQCKAIKNDISTGDVVRLNMISTFLSFDAESGKECRFFTSSKKDNKEFIIKMNKLMYGEIREEEKRGRDYAVVISEIANSKSETYNYVSILKRVVE